jgi:hypothetical protein
MVQLRTLPTLLKTTKLIPSKALGVENVKEQKSWNNPREQKDRDEILLENFKL